MTDHYFKQQVSEDIFKQKYCLHPNDTSWSSVARQVAEEISMPEKKKNRYKWENIFFDEIVSGRFIPGGRILANARVNSSMKNYSNCFTISLEDDMEGIYTALKEDALISKVGGGVGFNVSNIRPESAELSIGGVASGPISFLEIFNQSAKTIMTGGYRRAAHIAIMNVDHPDIEKFVTYKQGDKENRLTQFNISVGITEEFINAVIMDESWDLVFDGVVYKTVSAKDLFNMITKNAYEHNEPGIYFIDEANRYNSAPWAFNLDRVNPCLSGETMVAVADGRNAVSIEDLAKNGTPFPVYSAHRSSCSLGWKSEIKQAIAFPTGKRELIRVCLSDGSSFVCTPDHLLATNNGEYVCAKDSTGITLGKFYSFSNKNTKKSYRHINTKSNGYMRQYRMIWEYYNGEYCSPYSVHHKDHDTTNDLLKNLSLTDDCMDDHDRTGLDNPINKINPERLSMLQRHKNVYGNAKRYNWSNDVIEQKLSEIGPIPEIEDKNVDMSERVCVTEVIETMRTETVYDLTVEDNHNFYIITKTDDGNFLNSSGVLVHNCGEITMGPYSLCDLGAINLTKFVLNPFTDKATFDWDSYENVISVGIRLLDNVLDRTKYPLPKIEEMSKKWRRIGLGITGLGDAFAMMGMTYGDKESLEFSTTASELLKTQSYITSIELAREKGKYPAFDKRTLDTPFIRNLPESIWNGIKKYGIRNIAMNTIAPTGTISLSVGNNCSSGIEPIFALEYNRNIRTEKDDVRTELVQDYAWKVYNELENDKLVDPTYKKCFVTTKDISGENAISVQAIWQRHIDHSISKTHNLAPGTTLDEYRDLLFMAHMRGLKGFTSFNPEGSMKGVLEYNDNSKEAAKPSGNHAVKRPKKIPCDIHFAKVKGEQFLLLVGKCENGDPYEIFVTDMKGRSFDIEKNKTGTIDKVKKGCYNLIINDDVIIENISKEFDSTLGTLSRFISMSIRHNVPLQFIVEQLHKGNGFASFEKVVGRILKKYIPQQEKVMTSDKCPVCNSDLMYVEGCKKCTNLCGWEACG